MAGKRQDVPEAPAATTADPERVDVCDVLEDYWIDLLRKAIEKKEPLPDAQMGKLIKCFEAGMIGHARWARRTALGAGAEESDDEYDGETTPDGVPKPPLLTFNNPYMQSGRRNCAPSNGKAAADPGGNGHAAAG